MRKYHETKQYINNKIPNTILKLDKRTSTNGLVNKKNYDKA